MGAMKGQALRMRVSFPFDEGSFPNDLGGYISVSALSGSAPILYVAHHSDNSWVLTDAQGDPNEEGALLVACVWDVVGRDPSLQEMSSLPVGTEAVRDRPGSPWRSRTFEDD